jgi:hypothetical protein
MVHKGDNTGRSPANFFWQILQSVINKNYKTKQHDRSEFSAYDTHLAFLNDEIAALQAICSYDDSCSYSHKE